MTDLEAHVSAAGRAELVKQVREPGPHVAGIVEVACNALGATAYGKCQAAHVRHECEHGFVGDIIADKQRTAALKRLMRHQFADTRGLVKSGMLDFTDAFSRQHFDRRVRQIGPDQRHRLVNRPFRMRRQPVVQRQRIALVFQQDAGTELGNAFENTLRVGHISECQVVLHCARIDFPPHAAPADRRRNTLPPICAPQ